MATLTFYPLGNADCCLIELATGKKILFDFGAQCEPDCEDEKRIDLIAAVREAMASARRQRFEVVAITHLDDDHTCRADEFFELDHAKKYQGEGRFGIDTLWVPSAVIIESRNELGPGAQALQAEARHRLRQGYGVRVFSRPAALNDWLAAHGLSLEARRGLITDAGELAPELNLSVDGVEFFVHSPFATRMDAATVVDRNRDALVMQATFLEAGRSTQVLLGSDMDYEAISGIVTETRRHRREDRLNWDVLKLPHHCSYLTIGPERGADKTTPARDSKWLFETQSQPGCIIVSPSRPIPRPRTLEDDSPQPPHRQAKVYYFEEVVGPKDGEFLVTMEHPNTDSPQPLVIEISPRGAKVWKRSSVGALTIVSRPAPRAG